MMIVTSLRSQVCKAEFIVTANTRDFPAAKLKGHQLMAITPDHFTLELIARNGQQRILEVLRRQAVALNNPPMSASELLDNLSSLGLKRAGKLLRQ